MVLRTRSVAPSHRRKADQAQTMRSLERMQRRVQHERADCPVCSGGFAPHTLVQKYRLACAPDAPVLAKAALVQRLILVRKPFPNCPRLRFNLRDRF